MENNALYRLLVKSWELIFAKLHVKIDNFPKIKFQFTKRWFLDLTTLPARISKYHFEPLLSVLNPTKNHMICLPFLFSFFFFSNKHSHFCLFSNWLFILFPSFLSWLQNQTVTEAGTIVLSSCSYHFQGTAWYIIIKTLCNSNTVTDNYN